MKRETKFLFLFITFSFLIPFSFFEFYLRAKGINACYEEQIGASSYTSPYPNNIDVGTIQRYEPNSHCNFTQNEFTRTINANSEGFND